MSISVTSFVVMENHTNVTAIDRPPSLPQNTAFVPSRRARLAVVVPPLLNCSPESAPVHVPKAASRAATALPAPMLAGTVTVFSFQLMPPAGRCQPVSSKSVGSEDDGVQVPRLLCSMTFG